MADADGFHVDASNLPVANVVSPVKTISITDHGSHRIRKQHFSLLV